MQNSRLEHYLNVSGYVLLPCIAFMGSLPRVTSRNGILTFTITELHLLDAQRHIGSVNDNDSNISSGDNGSSDTSSSDTSSSDKGSNSQQRMLASQCHNRGGLEPWAHLRPCLGLR